MQSTVESSPSPSGEKGESDAVSEAKEEMPSPAEDQQSAASGADNSNGAAAEEPARTNGHDEAGLDGGGPPAEGSQETDLVPAPGDNGVKELGQDEGILGPTNNVIDKLDSGPGPASAGGNELEPQQAAAPEHQQQNQQSSSMGGASVLQTDPQKSAFMAPSKVEEFMPSAAMQQQQQQQQQQMMQQQAMFQAQQHQHAGLDGSDVMKFNNGTMDYNYRNGAPGHPGMQPQIPTNSWGALDDINNINYGQPPPGHMTAAGLMGGNGMAPQMAGMARRPITSASYQQQQQAAAFAAARQQPQHYPGQPQPGYMINRQYGAAATGWPNCAPAGGSNWSSGMPPPGMGAPGTIGSWGGGGGGGRGGGGHRMGGSGGMSMQNRGGRGMFGGSQGPFPQQHQQGNQYPHHYRRSRQHMGYPNAKGDGEDVRSHSNASKQRLL